jgi:hypothetical protein
MFLTFFWTVYLALDWGLKGDYQHFRQVGVERVTAELLGIDIAVAAVFLLERILARRSTAVLGEAQE